MVPSTAPRFRARPPLSPRMSAARWRLLALCLVPCLVLAMSLARADDAKLLEQLRAKAAASDQQRDQEFRQLVEQGRQFLQKGEYGEAQRVLSRAAQLKPDDAPCADLLAQARAALATSKPDDVLARVRERWGGRDTTLRRQLDQGLFDAEQSLQQGQHAQAAQHARRVLHGVAYVQDAPTAAELRTRAEGILAVAEKGQSAAEVARQRAEMEAKRQAATQQSDDSLRGVRERGWKHLGKGEHAQALAAAEDMLKLAPGNEPALFLKNEALKAKQKAEGLDGLRTERKKAENDHLIRDLEREATLPKDIAEAKVVLPDKAAQRRPQLVERPMEPWEIRLRARLREPVTFEFNNTSVTEACRYLGELTESTIFVDPAVAKDTARHTLPRMTLSYEHALRWLCRLWHATYVVRDHAILVTRGGTGGGRLDEPVMRTYDVTGLLLPVRTIQASLETSTGLDKTGPPQTMKAGPPEAKDDGTAKQGIGEGWADFIRTTVAPESWDPGDKSRTLQEPAQGPRYTIQYRNGRIVVVHTPEVHEQIAELLENYRKARNLQVHIQARILSIDMDYFQQIGVNFPGSDGGTPDDPTDDLPGFLDPREAPPANPNRAWQRWEIAGNVEHEPGIGAIPEGFSEPYGGISVRYHYLNHTEVTAILEAVIKHRKGTLLIAPRITCFNTQRANFQALTNYNYVRSISSDEEPDIGNVPDGIIFDVQPFISADRRYITLVLQPQLRTLRGLQSFSYISSMTLTRDRAVQLPTTQLASVATTVTVPDGGSLIVGGLASVTEHSGMASLPFFYAVPGLRYLLRQTTENERRTSLVIIVTAEIVKDIFEQE